MPPSAVRERLARLGRAAGAPAAARRPAVERIVPPGFEAVETEHGTAWRYADMLAAGRLPGPPPAVPHAYLDTETTGLSGGAGTQVFAVAVCRPCSAGLELTQVFLADPAGEAAFLALVQEELDRACGVATYNGSRFDLPLLRTRWVMARMPGELRYPAHVDLLNVTRALLRYRLERCTLRAVEERLLGFEREDDLASALVPEAYLGYLRHGWSPLLPRALEHNRQDVVSLYYLHARLNLRLSGRDPWMEGPDWLALGRHLFRTGRRADGWRALRNSAELADGPESARAALMLARRLARRRRHQAAERLLARTEGGGPASGEPQVAIARARLLEWKLGDLATARDVVRDALATLPPGSPFRTDLEWRLQRLERRLYVQAAKWSAPEFDGGS